MTKVFLAAGVAALAIAAPTVAKPGGGGGEHGGGNGRHAAEAQHGGGGGGGQKAEHQARQQQANVGRQQQRQQRFEFAKPANEHRFNQQNRVFEARNKHQDRVLERVRKAENRRFEAQRDSARNVARDRSKQFERIAERNRAFEDSDNRFVNGRGLVDGCPPGLAKKLNGCLPPGQAKKLIGQSVNSLARAASLSALPLAARSLYPDTSDYYYRYGDNGYLYKVDRNTNLVNSLLPLIGGGLLPGQMFPTSYASNYMPSYFNGMYPDTPYVDYRYANGNIYGVDPYTGMIENVVPMYANGYGVGQALPAGYGYYNVPYQYRDMYPNTANSNYWYAPGAIYQVDPTTQLITSVASLLAPGLSIGQQLPAGYGTYNVPMAYRDTYYDTPNALYRYNNGNIYQVDPTTQLVTAIVASILT